MKEKITTIIIIMTFVFICISCTTQLKVSGINSYTGDASGDASENLPYAIPTPTPIPPNNIYTPPSTIPPTTCTAQYTPRDKIKPTVTGVKNNKTYKKQVTIKFKIKIKKK